MILWAQRPGVATLWLYQPQHTQRSHRPGLAPPTAAVVLGGHPIVLASPRYWVFRALFGNSKPAIQCQASLRFSPWLLPSWASSTAHLPAVSPGLSQHQASAALHDAFRLQQGWDYRLKHGWLLPRQPSPASAPFVCLIADAKWMQSCAALRSFVVTEWERAPTIKQAKLLIVQIWKLRSRDWACQ